jgi:phage portal protein BeeE
MLRQAVETLDALAKEIAGIPGESLPSEAVRLAEAVSAARRALYVELIRQGWLPPHQVPAGVELDARLLAEGLGAGFDNPSLRD